MIWNKHTNQIVPTTFDNQKKAEEIQEKVIELEKNLKSIKDKEDKMMSELHSKYGQFGLQDIYDTIMQ